MMRDRPSGTELLALAAAMPCDEPALLERCRGIAEREGRAGDAARAAWRDTLAALYGEGDETALMHRLAADIRAGALDAPGRRRDEIRRLLWAITRQKLRESNPQFLADCDQE